VNDLATFIRVLHRKDIYRYFPWKREYNADSLEMLPLSKPFIPLNLFCFCSTGMKPLLLLFHRGLKLIGVKRMKREFYVVIEKDEDGFFVGEVPTLKACYSQARQSMN